jgi:SAM-dependent methyltransferase
MTEETLPSSMDDIHESIPQSAEEVQSRHEQNRAAWNEGAQYYTRQIEETIAFLREGKSNLHPVERRNLGDISQYHTAIHLQCASGRDTLSLWIEGAAEVVGVDISDVHIENARKISAALNAPARWYRSDVLDMPRELDGTADLVYTGRGALCWIQDIDAYARSAARLLKPGGVYHVLDDHPANWLFDTNADTLRWSGFSYFTTSISSVGWPTTYIGDSLDVPAAQQARKYERLWTLSQIFTALTAAGLRVEIIGEHPEMYWDAFPNLTDEDRAKIPMTFSMLARK